LKSIGLFKSTVIYFFFFLKWHADSFVGVHRFPPHIILLNAAFYCTWMSRIPVHYCMFCSQDSFLLPIPLFLPSTFSLSPMALQPKLSLGLLYLSPPTLSIQRRSPPGSITPSSHLFRGLPFGLLPCILLLRALFVIRHSY